MAENYGIKVSLEGYDVWDATELQTAFSNNSNLLKVSSTGSGTIPAGGVVTINHNLGYIPQFLVYGDGSSGNINLATGDIWDNIVAGSNTTNLSIAGSVGSSYRYYIFYETIDGTSQSVTVSNRDYGVKVMKTGYDITDKDLDHQSLNSEKNCLKIAKKDVYSTTSASSGNNTVSIAHGLSYTPGYMFWFEIGGDGKHYFGTSGDYILYNYVDATNINFTYSGISSGTSIKLYYILFVENSI